MPIQLPGVEEKFVELSHGRTRYLEAGAGDPTILIHGVTYTGGAHSWALNIGQLSSKLRVLAVDCVGWGFGDFLQQEYSFAYLVDFIREFQDALGLEKTNIVGHSMGGWLASVFAYESPNRVDKLVLLAAGGSKVRTLSSMTEFQPPSREGIRKHLDATVKAAPDMMDALEEEHFRTTEVPGHLDAYRRVLAHMNNGETRNRYNTQRRLAHVNLPTLVLWGTADEINDIEMAHICHGLVKGAKLALIEGGDHFIPTNRSEEVNRELLDFLAG